MLLWEIINYRYKGLLLQYYSNPLQQTVPYFTEKSGTFFIAEGIEETGKTETAKTELWQTSPKMEKNNGQQDGNLTHCDSAYQPSHPSLDRPNSRPL